MMAKSHLTYAFAALLCASLFFSCTPEIEQPPPPPTQQRSSSSIELSFSSLNEPRSSSSTPFTTPNSSPTQSSANLQKSSSSQSVQKSSSSLGCKESNPKSGFTCSWDATGTLLPGTTIKPLGTPPSDCTVAWQYKDDISPFADCLETTQNGLASKSNSTYFLWAELTCSDGKHVNACAPTDGLSSKQAPSLTGTCTWDYNPTTTARGATPRGVSVVDFDYVCNNPTVVYKYANGTKTWPTDGLVDAGTYNDVRATLSCPAYSQTVTTTCPSLTVNPSADYAIECYWDKYGCENYDWVFLGVDECVEINVHADYYYDALLQMRCMSSGSFYLSLNGKTPTSLGYIFLGQLKQGYNEFGTVCLTDINGATYVECYIEPY